MVKKEVEGVNTFTFVKNVDKLEKECPESTYCELCSKPYVQSKQVYSTHQQIWDQCEDITTRG